MNCEHCNDMRTKLREIAARHQVEYLSAFDEIARDLREVQAPPAAAVGACPCECHTPARIAGTLPRLEAST